jgi:hypothetical protein
MYKATAKDIKMLQRYGADNEVVAAMMKRQEQPGLYEIAYFSPANANWSWTIGLATIDSNLYELLTRFGVVEGGRQVYNPVYTSSDNGLIRA